MRYKIFAVLAALLCAFTMAFAFYWSVPVTALSQQKPAATEYKDCMQPEKLGYKAEVKKHLHQ